MILSDLRELDIFSPEFMRDPHGVLGPIQAEQWVARSERGLEVLSYEACQDVFTHPRLFVGFAEAFVATGITEGPAFELATRNFANLEGPTHTRLRKAVAPYFTADRIESMRELARQLVTEWLSESSETGECDVMTCIGLRLPAAMFCAMIGVPLSDCGHVARYSLAMTKFFLRNPEYHDEIEAKFAELEVYVNDIIDLKREEPRDDLITMLLAAEARSELSPDELARTVMTLLWASSGTTNSQLCQNFVTLAEHPDQWRVLKSEPEHVPTAVLEMTRYAPVFMASARSAREGGEFRGVELPPGTGVWANHLAAHRDPKVYESPERFDVHRRARPPLIWGVGRHFCLGRGLAIMEMEETLRAALDLWSDFEVAGEAEECVGAPFLVLPRRVPVRFELEVAPKAPV